jgi:Helicase associated domain
MFGTLLLFRDTHGHCRVPPAYKDKKLANWVDTQRAFATKGILSTVRKQRLDAIGFDWDPRETDWAEGFRYLTIYKEREGHCRVPYDHVEDGFNLGLWVANRRATPESMPSNRRQQLDDLGFLWDPFEADWQEGFSYLKAYKEREGHCRVAKDHMENGFQLGRWVATRRAKVESISATRRQQLDDLGFVWKVFEADWEEGFTHLKAYR